MHPLLRNFGDEFNAVLVRLLAYASGLAILALIAADVVGGGVGGAAAPVPEPQARWSAAVRPHAAFSLPLTELNTKTIAYEILRHPEGGRRDILSWSEPGAARPLARVEIYRPGGEIAGFGPAATAIAERAGLSGPDRVQAAGVVGSKFGPVGLLGFDGDSPEAAQCLGFMLPFESARAAVTGWFCGANAAAVRTLAACALDRLTLVAAGSDARLAELFARAELKRGACASSGQPVVAQANADWITAPDAPQLRGRLARD
ncbi:MAG: hypothetical protein EPO23_14360 [Xanthobacteraceae bacterium]|nr:MAG: hypothetical protein EPO23_14360 [Xanthobacteraceae bacterium]